MVLLRSRPFPRTLAECFRVRQSKAFWISPGDSGCRAFLIRLRSHSAPAGRQLAAQNPFEDTSARCKARDLTNRWSQPLAGAMTGLIL